MKQSSATIEPPTAMSDGEVRRSAGRPRSETARRAVLEASYAVLLETGPAGFSIDAVALRSGVARTTIYRSWPVKGMLAIESFLAAFRPQLAYAQTGHAAENFRALVCSLARALDGPAGRVAASVMAHAQSDPETQRMFRELFSEPLRRESSRLLLAGMERGELRSDMDIARVLDAAVGAVYLRLMFGQSLDEDWARSLSETILRGCLNDPSATRVT